MKKRDFIQQASSQFMPSLEWDVDKSIRYAEQLWTRLNEKGYGDSKPAEMKQTVNAYDTLSAVAKNQFDTFWVAFGYKKNRQRAAMKWQELGELSPIKLLHIVSAAKKTAEERKALPEGQVWKMAEGWLAELRYDDYQETHAEKQGKVENKQAAKIREVTGDLNHAKKMTNDTEDEFWPKELKRLEQKLRELRK